ncbi:gliding motility-associated C-terminal domain-containing protein [Dyadobacter sp. CY323]|uniref:T9SS type B sorting domain-containing protein n=1 Tax=Dyadobacter sp. CY323 TaxID=2907302 RepID=UPI001F23E72C|nr:gliding motility-associated C-terminal domain-containing protein [Dyadobacter sp. CY323]MCE6989037.1 gliding motility-associated C-terminal domain-containing protein [Dyadobacter sp. CY323]
MPLTFTLTNNVQNALSLAYSIGYDGKSQNPVIQNLSTVTIPTPGTFIVLQQAVTSSGQVYACKTVRVYEARPVTAQYSSCGGGKISLTLTDDIISRAYDQVEIKWGDGQSEIWTKGNSMALEHMYASTANSPTVSITGLYAAGTACEKGVPFQLPISFQQAQLNEIEIKSVEMRGDGTLRINYQGVVGIPTEIKYAPNAGNYVVDGKRSSGGIQPYDIKNQNVNQVYNLKLSSADLCQGTRDSKVYSSMTLSGQSSEGENVLSWSRYPDADGFAGYDLLRDGTVIKSFTSISEITYTDKDVQCGSYSEYQVVAKIGDVVSTSAPIGIKAEITSPKPISAASVSVLGSNVVLIKANVPGSGSNGTYNMTIEKADAGTTTFKKIITLFNQSEYSDIDVKTNDISYCYRISYENSCGQKLPPSEPICTMLLQKNRTTLSWTTPLPVLGGITGYDVMQTGSTSTADVIPVKMNTQYTVRLNAQSDLEYNFQIRAASTDGAFESLSNIINFKRSAGVFVPDAFTPNGDGYNDVLEAKSSQLQSFNFSVMNRWGEVVFHSEDIAVGWDGMVNGMNAPVGSYVYKMTFVDDINQTVEKSGTFMLLR